jgi:hypothetical protein
MSELTSQPTPIQEIYDWYRSERLIVNRAYQRKLVWTQQEKQKLIDSILRQYPVPLILLAEPEASTGAKYEIIDGLQRLHSIMSFIEMAFSTPENKYFDVNEFARAKDESENGKFARLENVDLLDRPSVARILSYVLPVSIIRKATNAVVTDVFSRINSYGHQLSEQERRQAGQITALAQLVRDLSSDVRGDASSEILPLTNMPQVSIELARTNAGYAVDAASVFWVEQGILRSTDLRDSADEQIIADAIVCIVNGIVDRSKETLDEAFDNSTVLASNVSDKISTYGQDRVKSEIKYCLETIEKIVVSSGEKSLGRLIFENFVGNSFATVFSAILFAVHELSFGESLVLADAGKAAKGLKDIHGNMGTTRKSLSVDERRKNIDLVKGRIRDSFVTGDVSKLAYSGSRVVDIENTIRRVSTESSLFEVKQGILNLYDQRQINDKVFTKILATICAIANVSPIAKGSIIIGVADKKADVELIEKLDGVIADEIAGRYVVGVDREFAHSGLDAEAYFQTWRDKIKSSKLSEELKLGVLSSLEMVEYKGKKLVLIPVSGQPSPSFLDGKMFLRSADETVEASAQQAIAVSQRFAAA